MDNNEMVAETKIRLDELGFALKDHEQVFKKQDEKITQNKKEVEHIFEILK
jgi:hypothetical protein